jgi:hypothetical protein
LRLIEADEKFHAPARQNATDTTINAEIAAILGTAYDSACFANSAVNRCVPTINAEDAEIAELFG